MTDEEQLREIARAVADYDFTYCGIELGMQCAFDAHQRAHGLPEFGCARDPDTANRIRYLQHGQACPVTTARALLSGRSEP